MEPARLILARAMVTMTLLALTHLIDIQTAFWITAIDSGTGMAAATVSLYIGLRKRGHCIMELAHSVLGRATITLPHFHSDPLINKNATV